MVLHCFKRANLFAVRRSVECRAPRATIRWTKLVAFRIEASGESCGTKSASSVVKRALRLARTRAVPQTTPRFSDSDAEGCSGAVVERQINATVA